MTLTTPPHPSSCNRTMHKTTFSLFAALLSLALFSACSHPVAELAYPDGSVRTPINPQKDTPKRGDQPGGRS